ncbi:related to telomeric DNA binding activity [Rhynchosporium agropyri]|uniref:Related to telomeric DNA binding activity n=1 Tax=Rhynchosporium agropyri TaxID=914238 RepID=A0A1E1KZA1_9HELO|nr:related to telomeric DNA binding activity [Rhynchosporium agropyri]
MSAVASKNLYELLGNNHDEDSDKEPEPPVKVIDKTPARTTKRNAPAEAPASRAPAPTEGRGGRRGGFNGNEGAFRDRNAGSANNRTKPTEDGRQDRPARAQGTYDGRGARRGGGRGGNNMDRHSRTVGGESEKQAGHGWGAIEGGAELADEQAGEAIANAEAKEALGGDAAPNDTVAEVEAEPEDNSKSYSEYLAEQAEKKLALGAGIPEARKPNEGSKQDKKWANAKAIAKEEEEDFVSASAGKAKRERERKQKQTIDIDQRFVEAPEQRGGRGGGFPRGGGRGRGDGPARGGRGEFRGNRGEGRGGRGGRGDGPSRGARVGGGPPRGGSASINTSDTSAFPSLGA